jgi:hypothetical protein
MFILSIILIVILPIVFWQHRNHPLITVRLPILVIVELLLDLWLLFVVSSLFSTWSAQIWGHVACWFQNSLNAGLGALLWNVTMSRIIIFHLLRKSNSLEPSKDFLQGKFDRFIHWVGYFMAPKEYLRLEQRILAKSKISSTSASASAASSTSHQTETSLMTENGEHSAWRIIFSNENLRWYGKLLLWYVGWTLLSIATTVGTDTVPVLFQLLPEGEICPLTIFTQIGAHLIIWNCIQLALVVFISWNAENDSLGLKTELVIMQSIFSVFWGIDGLIMVIDVDLYASIGIWTDLIAMVVHALVTFGYPIFLVYFRKHQEYKIVASGLVHVKNTRDFEKLWFNSIARPKIIEIAKRNYAVENIVFLQATDEIATMTLKQTEALYGQHFESCSPYEVNLPSKLIRPLHEGIKKKQINYEALKEAREHILQMMLTNFKSDILVEFKDSIYANAERDIVVKSADMKRAPARLPDNPTSQALKTINSIKGTESNGDSNSVDNSAMKSARTGGSNTRGNPEKKSEKKEKKDKKSSNTAESTDQAAATKIMTSAETESPAISEPAVKVEVVVDVPAPVTATDGDPPAQADQERKQESNPKLDNVA